MGGLFLERRAETLDRRVNIINTRITFSKVLFTCHYLFCLKRVSNSRKSLITEPL
jgi:hypothetical protein